MLPTAIASRSNPLLQRLRKLAQDPSAYRKLGTVWIEGEHLCEAYAKTGLPIAQAVITDAAWQSPSLRDVASRAQSVAVVSSALMASLSALESAPPIAFAVAWRGAGELTAKRPTVVLDRVQDAGNVGSVLRSAAAFGFAQVVALGGTAALWSPKVLRAGMGAHFGLNLVESVSADQLAKLGLPLFAANPHGTVRLDHARLPWPCAWVLGHEGQGVSAEVLAHCHQALTIPQPGGQESLNVAAAGAVCLYESARQAAIPDRDRL